MTGKRTIKRIAFLQEYENRPWKLKELIPEVAHKGYAAAAFAAQIGQEAFIAELAAEARQHNLEVMAFTGFMKYQQAWLKEHPDQTIRLNNDVEAVDQDYASVFWGCPFNPAFQKRYFDFLHQLGAIPNMTEVWVNDEALLGFGPDKLACYCAVCRRDWEAEFGAPMPRPPFPSLVAKARFVNWRFRRWNAVHAQMKTALSHDHVVRAVFLASPACCVDMNPWISGVDLASMVQFIDGVMTDPYYTFHEAIALNFKPREVYLSECCRMLAGICGPDKQAEICAQGFSQGTFTRPLDERDGWWAGIVPAVLGIRAVTAYTYTLQRISPMQKTYERTFELDHIFSQTAPVDFAGVVNSLETQCFHVVGDRGPSWLVTRLFPTTEMLRHQALPYAFVPSSRLDPENLRRFPVMILPGVSCLSAAARDALRDYVKGGGILIACGETANRDENGEPLQDGSWLNEVFGICAMTPMQRAEQLKACGDPPAFRNLPWPDETTGGYNDGIYYPVLGLNHAVQIEARPDVETLAVWRSGARAPAIAIRRFGDGQAVFVAGLPGRIFYREDVKLTTQNFIGHVLGKLILQMAGRRLPIRANGFTSAIPMYRLRPLDPRLMPTAEFMPCVGKNLYLATVASYFREPMRFEVEISVPAGKTCAKIKELTANKLIRDFTTAGDRVAIDVALTPDDCIKVFAFFLK
ncbi:MAG: beta-galactosidase trimerization domain-containing protein [Kiritimatiellae bacterium]|nr:beta-galactosidase trimerization domain-containing protein [Kiritimatiellia bacterium]